MFFVGEFEHFVGNDVGRVVLAKFLYVGCELRELLGVVHGIDGELQQRCGCVGVLHVEGCVLVDEGESVLRLVVFCHIGRRHEYDGLAYQTELAD